MTCRDCLRVIFADELQRQTSKKSGKKLKVIESKRAWWRWQMDLVEYTNYGPNKEYAKLQLLRSVLNAIPKDTLQHGMARLNALEAAYAQEIRIAELLEKCEMSEFNYCFTLKVSQFALHDCHRLA